MSEKPKLLPCPFCGGEARFTWSFGSMMAECTKCFARKSCDDSAWGDELEASAAANWNMRAPVEAKT